ncbi:MAG TPA: response regulator transcription factor [Actinophytocola sp.]|uniref:response regulator transcription factor n=1 Tax=Actinophytocola sp. TaxID=1872138 RepID=UPI002DBC0F89|nr:response regulator transcription factor [Actinophytocola sp.]HEU5470910.1 response regulator transcription factor [Actinophytocola sp.]
MPGRVHREAAGRRRRLDTPRPDGTVVRVLVADENELTRTAIAARLDIEDDLEVVAQVADGRAAVDAALAWHPDVAVVDLALPELDGLAFTAELARLLPACGVVIVTEHGGPGYLKRALAAGVKGFLPKVGPGAKLVDVIRRVRDGGRYVDPVMAADALTAPDCPLTPRQLEVLRLAEYDTPVAVIAQRTNLSIGTVRNYLAAAVRKLGAANRADACRIARANGWL